MSLTAELIKKSMASQHPDFIISRATPGVWDHIITLVNQDSYSLEYVLERIDHAFRNQESISTRDIIQLFTLLHD